MTNSQSKVSPSTHRSKRKSSLIVVLNDLRQLSPPPLQLPTLVSSCKDYRRLATSEERVAAAHKAYKRDILDKHGTIDSTLDFDRNTIDEFMEGQKTLGLTSDEVHLLYREIAFAQVLEKAAFDPFRILRMFGKMLMGYADLATDLATLKLYATLNPMIAVVQGVVLLFSFLVQCVSSIVLGQPMWVGLMGLIGMKPMVEVWRDATEAKPFPGQKVGNEIMLWLTHGFEMVVSCYVELVRVFASKSNILFRRCFASLPR